MFEAEQKRIDDQIKSWLKQRGLPDLPLQWNSVPFSGHWGITTSFFQIASAEARQSGGKVNVPERAGVLAAEAAAHLGLPDGFEKVEAVKGYLNLYYSSAEYTRRVVDEVIGQGTQYGRGARKNEQIMIEFSHPNTHKAFHVGHLRSAFLGDVLARILDGAGYDVVRANYPGDIGLHVIKWLWNYMKFHNGEKPPTEGKTRWMGALYAEANRRLEENPDLEADMRAVYSRWDQQDPEIVALWKETRQWSLDGFNEMYDLLDIRFDKYYFPSMAVQPGKEIVDDLIKRGIAEDGRPENAVVVKIDEKLGLKNEKYRVMVILRSDSTALYATEDLALVQMKFNDYPKLEKSIYVVDVRQALYFQQLFKTLEIAGYPKAVNCLHIPYELVTLPGNVAMASREGTVVLLEDLIHEAVQRALEIVKTKNPDLDPVDQEAIAKAVALGAIRYPMIARETTKLVSFDWEAALDFNGQAAPYIQYAYVRTGSILRKVEGSPPDSIVPESELLPAEIELVNCISRLPREVQAAAADYRPLGIAALAYDLARAFNDFYNQCPVLQAPEPVRSSRLRLVMAARQAIGNALTLLGIQAPQAM